MPTDIETELIQMWAGSRVIADLLISKLPESESPLTVSSVGIRPGLHHQLVGLQQIMKLAQSYTLELATKALYKTLYPSCSPSHTHELSKLFDSLEEDVKIHLRSEWADAEGRSPIGQELTYDEFLNRYNQLFNDSRYLYEGKPSFTWASRDFDIAIYLVTGLLDRRRSDGIVLRNVANMLSEGRGGSLPPEVLRFIGENVDG